MGEGFLARVRAQLPALGRAEQAVARLIVDDPERVVELSSTQLAQLSGTSRPTVVRTCQSLGLSGYQQLRVLLARESALAQSASVPEPTSGALGAVLAHFHHVASGVEDMTALLTEDLLETAVDALVTARRLVVVGHGVSASLAQDTAARLTTLGRLAEHQVDVIQEQIALSGLGGSDVALILSGSGTNALSLDAARTARRAGARVVALTAFSHAPLAECADTVLVTGMRTPSFRDEVVQTSRIPQVILLESLVALTARGLGEAAREAKSRALDVVSRFVEE